MMAVHDAMDVLSGKWKIYIISSVCHYNKRRFSDILNDVVGISNKMLSKELKETRNEQTDQAYSSKHTPCNGAVRTDQARQNIADDHQ